MAEESPAGMEPQQPRQVESLGGLQGAELRIKSSICKSVQLKVESILHDVERFSDIEKLYLYLKLPSYPNNNAEKSDHSALSSSRIQQVHAFSWIRNHLEEYPETSLPKQEVYDEYKNFCDNLNYQPLSAADFGKMMKNVFPNMKARRLGMRGKSKYCYSGLRKRPFVHMPSLPTLDLHKPADGNHCDVLESSGQLSTIQEDVRFAACDLVCEWAQKVLKRQFDAVEDLARFLIDSHYINNKSMAALTMMTGTAAEAKTPQTIPAFGPIAEPHSHQPHTATLSSPSVDAKQQLQRKIQRKQQEQKLQSPAPREGQTKRGDDSVPCETPTPPIPQPTIGLVVTAVPSPIPIPRSTSQLMSQSPVATLESKVLPINIQMVTQPTKAVKPNPKVLPNIIPSTVVDRTSRQRYAQILPKPSATTAIALRSPSAMIIANNPVKTVMTTCHVSPVNFVTMTAISLAPTSSETTTALMTNALCSTPTGIGSAPEEDFCSTLSTRSVSAAPILASVSSAAHKDNSQNTDAEMVNSDLCNDNQSQSPECRDLAQAANLNRGGSSVQRAASVPIPQTKGLLGLHESSTSKNTGKAPLSIHATARSSIDIVNKRMAPCSQNTASGLLSSCRTSSFDDIVSAKEGLVSRKRSGLSPDFTPVKRVFTAQQSAEGTAGLGFLPRPGAPVRPESAPVTREVEMRMNSTLSTQIQTVCTSSFRASGFYSVAKTQSSMTRNNISVMETGTLVSHPLMQQQQGHTAVKNMHTNPSFQRYSGTGSTTENIEEAPEHTCTQSNSAPETLDFPNQTSSGSHAHPQTEMDYFHFDDDLTQDSIMEELVQMEEQMKLNRLQELRGCVAVQSHQSVMTDSSVNNHTAYYHPATNHSNPVQTPTPTPTPTSEMMAHSLTGESPCSHIASTTPVDSALGSSRYTPAGTPHSNCSSTVPASPVECRNQFAFTPINSNITSFPDNNTVSSSPVKPMQRPMATHPDKARLEWMNNSYNSSSGNTKMSNSGMGILPSYQGYQFQKPHAFAIPHVRHNDSHCSRLTPISPVQQQFTTMANVTRQEGFAVPAPLDNKTTNQSVGTFRCRSVSPAVHQRNNIGNTGSSAPLNVPHSVASAFNSLAPPEEMNIIGNSQADMGVSSMAQRSRSVPLNIMMQTNVRPSPGTQCTNQNISNVLLKKLDGDHNDSVRGVGLSNSPSAYTACMNLTQILESGPDLCCTNSHHNVMNSDSTSELQKPIHTMENYMSDSLSLSAGDSQLQSDSGEHLKMLGFRSLQQHQCDFNHSQDLLTGSGRSAGTRLSEQVSALTAGAADLSSELSSSITDLTALDTHLLFDPSLQQGSYQNAVSEELVNNQLFQQITSEAAHANDLDWLESKDHPTVGLMG